MISYAFDLMNRDGSIDSFEVGAFDSDIEALQHAGAALIASATAFAVNIWCDGVRVGRVRRDVPVPTPAPSAGREAQVSL